VKRRGEGAFTAFLGFYPTGSQPDAGNLYDFFFGADRDYYQDQTIHDAGKTGVNDFDAAKRKEAFTYMADRVNTMNYILPVSSLPTAYAMTRRLRSSPTRSPTPAFT
jgi:hypothetical protein